MHYEIQPTDLVHERAWNHHKYISKKRVNGKWRYIYKQKSTSRNDPYYYAITRDIRRQSNVDGSTIYAYEDGRDKDPTARVKIIRNPDGSTSVSTLGGNGYRIGPGVKSYNKVKDDLLSYHRDMTINPEKYKHQYLSEYEDDIKKILSK